MEQRRAATSWCAGRDLGALRLARRRQRRRLRGRLATFDDIAAAGRASDVELTPDGSIAVAVLRTVGQVAYFPLPARMTDRPRSVAQVAIAADDCPPQPPDAGTPLDAGTATDAGPPVPYAASPGLGGPLDQRNLAALFANAARPRLRHPRPDHRGMSRSSTGWRSWCSRWASARTTTPSSCSTRRTPPAPSWSRAYQQERSPSPGLQRRESQTAASPSSRSPARFRRRRSSSPGTRCTRAVTAGRRPSTTSTGATQSISSRWSFQPSRCRPRRNTRDRSRTPVQMWVTQQDSVGRISFVDLATLQNPHRHRLRTQRGDSAMTRPFSFPLAVSFPSPPPCWRFHLRFPARILETATCGVGPRGSAADPDLIWVEPALSKAVTSSTRQRTPHPISVLRILASTFTVVATQFGVLISGGRGDAPGAGRHPRFRTAVRQPCRAGAYQESHRNSPDLHYAVLYYEPTAPRRRADRRHATTTKSPWWIPADLDCDRDVAQHLVARTQQHRLLLRQRDCLRGPQLHGSAHPARRPRHAAASAAQSSRRQRP